MNNGSKPKEKTAVAKLREQFYHIKKNRKPSDTLREIFKKEPNKKIENCDEKDKRVAIPQPPKPEAEL